jgi:hypothetical protein
MKKTPVIQGGNSEAVTTAKAIRRYLIEETRTPQNTPRHTPDDAAQNTFVYCCGVCRSFGVTLPQMFAALVWLSWELIKAKVAR